MVAAGYAVQFEGDASAMWLAVVQFKCAVMVAHKTLHHRQPQTRAAAAVRPEGADAFLQHVGWKTGAIVANTDDKLGSVTAGAEGDSSRLVAECLTGIQDQVEQCLPQLAVGQAANDTGRYLLHQLDMCGHLVMGECQQIPHGDFQIDFAQGFRLMLRLCQQFVEQLDNARRFP